MRRGARPGGLPGPATGRGPLHGLAFAVGVRHQGPRHPGLASPGPRGLGADTAPRFAGGKPGALRLCAPAYLLGPLLSLLLLTLGAALSPRAIAGDARRSGGDRLTFARPSSLAELRATSFVEGSPDARTAQGLALFMRDWLRTDAVEDRRKLGPHYDASSCARCHLEVGHGRGGTVPLIAKPLDARDALRFDGQINAHSTGPHALEGVRQVRLQTRRVSFADGTARVLQKPLVTIRATDGERTHAALRAAPLLFGWGLLEAVEPAMLAPFDDPDDLNRDGISGRSRTLGDGRKGIFGWKSAVADAKTQVATALYHDMGITTSAFVAGRKSPELSEADLHALTVFVRMLGVPDRLPETAQARRGERHFGDAGCALCHIPALMTTTHEDARFSEQLIWAYTDLMLHDLGEGLADPGHAADAAEWRTAPLWGIGVVERLLPARGFLHDGRAADIEEAILWHGGEAAPAQSAYRALSRAARADLLAYVRSL